MGKKKDGGGKKKGEGKAKTGPIPKTVAGLHVPREWREAGAKLIEAANSPVGREVIAAGLAVAVTAAEAAVLAKRKAGQAEAAPKAKTPDAEAFVNVAQDLLGRFFSTPRKG